MTRTESARTKEKNDQGQVWNFKGKYADYMRELTTGEGDDFKKIFDTIYHGYAFCALYGLLKGRRHIYDSKTDNPNDSLQQGFRWAYADSTGIYSYESIRRMVLLYDRTSNCTFEEKIDRALRFDYQASDATDEGLKSKARYKENSDIIDEYVLGGLEELHSKISKINTSSDMIEFMSETLNDFQELVRRKDQQTSVA